MLRHRAKQQQIDEIGSSQISCRLVPIGLVQKKNWRQECSDLKRKII